MAGVENEPHPTQELYLRKKDLRLWYVNPIQNNDSVARTM